MMNKPSFVCLLTLLCGLYAAPAGAETDEETLRHLKTVLWPSAYRNQDTTLLDQLLDDSFQMYDASGNHSNKQKELAWISNNEWDPGTFEYRIERLEIYNDDTAIVAGTGVASEYSYKSSNVLIKKEGKWRAISSHVSGYKPRGAPEQPKRSPEQKR